MMAAYEQVAMITAYEQDVRMTVYEQVMMTVHEQVAMMTAYEKDVRMTAYEEIVRISAFLVHCNARSNTGNPTSNPGSGKRLVLFSKS
jgi:hypothetical protein